MSLELEKIHQHIDEHLDEHVAKVQEWIRQRSVSNTGEGISECAELTRTYLEELGCQKTEIIEPGMTKWGMVGHPIVYGECDAGAEKTLMVYLMYDTMPADDESGWISPPFEARVVEQPPFKKVIIGRGALNSKGPQMAILNALRSIKAVAGEYPVNLMFVAEGDEERASVGLYKFVHDYKDRLSKADAMLRWGYQNEKGLVGCISGSEGLLYVELETSGKRWGKGPTQHSIHGGYKRYVDSPAWRHIKMLSTLVAEDGNEVLVKGWYDNMKQPTEEDLQLIDDMAKMFDPASAAKLLGINSFMDDLTGKELLVRGLYSTCLNLDGIWGGIMYPGTGGTILPDKLTSKHHARLVANQDGDDLVRKLRNHLDEHGYQDVEIRVLGNAPWLESNYDTDIARAAIRMLEEWGVKYMKIPGTGVSMLGPHWPGYLFGRDPLQLPIAGVGLGHGGLGHAYNEFYVVEGHEGVYGLPEAEKGYASVIYYYAGKA